MGEVPDESDLLDYKIPSIHEMPEVIPIIVESNDPEGPFEPKRRRRPSSSDSAFCLQRRLRCNRDQDLRVTDVSREGAQNNREALQRGRVSNPNNLTSPSFNIHLSKEF